MKRNREVVNCPTGSSSSSCPTYAEKGKMWVEDSRPDADMDELLAVLGYKVKSSDMVDVARNLEHLDNLMVQNDISHLSDNDNVHYNPSDLSGWLQSMLVEFKNPNQSSTSSNLDFGSTNGVICFSNDQESGFDGFDDDLRAIPGNVVLGSGGFEELEDGVEGNRKKIKSFSVGEDLTMVQRSLAGQPVVVVDTQEAGVRLVHTLMACAEAVEGNDMSLGDALVKHIRVLAEGSGVGAMRKVAGYFAEGLARRIYKISPRDLLESCYNDLLENHFYESCPYLKFAHFTANQAILEAFSGAKRVHVIDFSLKQGMQWPALLQALALRPGGPPAFRLTGVGLPQLDNSDSLQQVGWKLAQLAETIGVEFEFKGFVASSLADLDASILDIRPSEVESVAVNSVFEMHKLLARPNAFEKVLNSIKSMKPKIVTIVEQEGNHNGSVFLDRFNEALHYYSTMFDSLEGGYELNQPNNEDFVMSERYLGRQICNVVACEGIERVERHETLTQWRARMSSGGFEPVHLGSNAFKQASMLLALFGGDGYRVEENGGCLMLGWHTRPLIATSAWGILPGEFE